MINRNVKRMRSNVWEQQHVRLIGRPGARAGIFIQRTSRESRAIGISQSYTGPQKHQLALHLNSQHRVHRSEHPVPFSLLPRIGQGEILADS